MREESRTFWIPAAGGSADGRCTLELRPLADGRLALLAYTSRDSLLTGCGHRQPGVEVLARSLDEIAGTSGCDVVLVDGELPDHARRSAPPPGDVPRSFLQRA